MIIQVHTPKGIIGLDTEKNSVEDFAKHGLNKSEFTQPTTEERIVKLETDIKDLKTDTKV